MSWNPYFVHYASAHGRSAEEQLQTDRQACPGGTAAGFLCWMSGQRAAFKAAHPDAFLGNTLIDHRAWSEWLKQSAERPRVDREATLKGTP